MLRIDSHDAPTAQWTPLGEIGDTSFDVDHLVIAGGSVIAAPIVEMPIVANNIDLVEAAVLTHQYATSGTWYSLDVTIAGSLAIDTVSQINVSNRGYIVGRTAGNSTEGAATGQSGGSYGGLGMPDTGSANWTYGDYLDPTEPGSGGGTWWGTAGGHGGGLVRITTGSAAIDGSILASGGGGHYSGNVAGSGGGIRLDVGTLSGTGTIAAHGGAGYGTGGSGGGGRIAVYYDALDGFDVDEQAQAHGGNGGSGVGAVGTVYLKDTGGEGVLRIDSHDAPTAQWTPLGEIGDTSFQVDRLVIAGGSVIAAPISQFPILAGNVDIIEHGMLTHQYATGDDWYSLAMTIAGELTIDTDSSINVNNRGYIVGRTTGNSTDGAATGQSGGSYGGLGASDTGSANWTYGDYRDPVEPGSGGGEWWGTAGGRGGGLVRITTDSAAIDGSILASGGGGYYSGDVAGSGGGIRLDVGTFSGDGLIAAHGGAGYGSGSSGGGGRVAVYYDTLDGFEVDENVQAHGGNGGSGTGAVGTVYLKDTDGEGVLRIDSHDATTRQWTPLGEIGDTSFQVDRLVIAGASVIAAPIVEMPIDANNVDLIEGGVLTHQYTTGSTVYSLTMTIRSGLSIDATSAINVSNRGYIVGRTIGNSTHGAATGQSGGSYGGLGFSDTGSANPIYGNEEFPSEPGSGGGTWWGTAGGHGGGLIQITAGSAHIDGSVLARGGDGYYSGDVAGSGGGILLSLGSLTGEGIIAANGGSGYGTGGSGGGGRVAVYSWADAAWTLPTENITADGGTGGSGSGLAGTVYIAPPGVIAQMTSPTDELLHGMEMCQWFMAGVDPFGVYADLLLIGEGQPQLVAEGLDPADNFQLDTTAYADGVYELRAVLRDGDGDVVAETSRSITINNTAQWHSGTIDEDATWTAQVVHIVEGTAAIADGVTITIEPGAVIKFTNGAQISIGDGASLIAHGELTNPIIFTAIADDSAGGDTNLDDDDSSPRPGDWAGLTVQAGGQLDVNDDVELRYLTTTHSGTLAGSETWAANQLHYITANLVIPGGETLTIMPGAVVKFAPLTGLTVQAGATLSAVGTTAQPIIFTSDRDDAVAGDSNVDGDEAAPQAGDWRWIYIAGDAVFDHAQILYGGGTGGGWSQTGVIRTTGSASVIFANSVIKDAFFDGILAWGGPVTITNSVFTRIDRAICAHPGSVVDVINSTVDDNRIALLIHGGTLNTVNTIVSNSITSGMQFDFGAIGTIKYNNVWSPDGSGSVNYRNMTDHTGTNGNISANPNYRDADLDNYHLGYASPAIDAADTGAAPDTDQMGAPRYDDPRSTNTGIQANDTFADMGAFEFVEDADSDLDLIVVSVTGPSEMIAGRPAFVTWQIRNIGTATVNGAWHDRIELADLLGNTILVDEVVSSAEIGPNETVQFSAEVVVPGGTEASYHWRVTANSLGEVFEGRNSANNAGDSVTFAQLLLPELLVGGSLAGSFQAVGQPIYIKVHPDPGSDVVIRLDRVDDTGWSQLLLGRGAAPTMSSFYSQSPQFNEPDATVAIQSAGDQTYYVMLVPRSLPSGEVEYVITAEAAEYDLTSIGLTRGSTHGAVTIPLIGAQFDPSMQASLIEPGGTSHDASSIFFADSTLMHATFDLTGLPLGFYDVQVSLDGVTRTLDNVFRVIEGQAGVLETRVFMPEVIRSGREFTAWIEYENTGDTDLLSPVVIVSSTTGNDLGLVSGEDHEGASVTFLAVSPDGPAGTLRPGQSARTPVYIIGRNGSNNIRTYIADENSTNPMDWDAVSDVLEPDPECADWTTVWNGLIAGVEDTVGGYSELLSDAADLYQLRNGQATPFVGDNLGFYVRDLVSTLRTNLSGYVYLDDGITPAADVLVTAFPQSGGDAGVAYSTADGLVRFMGLAEGTYDISFAGAYLAPSDLLPVDVPATGTVSAGPWVLELSGQIMGRIIAPDSFVFDADAEISVTALTDDGTSFTGIISEDGGFVITGLPTGVYDIVLSGSVLCTVTADDINVTQGEIAAIYDLVTDYGGSISGQVTNAQTGLPIESATVTVTDDAGHPQGGITDEDGNFVINGITPGTHSVIADALGYQAQAVADVNIVQEETTADINFELNGAGSLGGTITSEQGALAEALVNVYLLDEIVATASTDGFGEYIFPEMPAGTYTIEIDHWEWALLTDTVTIADGEAVTYDAQLQPTSTTSGVAHSATDGSSLAGLIIGLLRPDGVFKIAPTIEDGSFGFGRLDPGEYTLMLLDGSHRQAITIGTEITKVELDLDLTVGSITGTVDVVDGESQIEDPVSVYMIVDDQIVLYNVMHAEGAFSLSGISPGTYSLAFVSGEYFYQTVTDVEVVAGEETVIPDVARGTLSLNVTVNDADSGSAITTGGVLQVRRIDATGLPTADRFVDVPDTGQVTIEGLAPGEYELSPIFENFATERWTVTLTAQNETIQLDLDDQAQLAGVVRDSQGNRIEDITVDVYDPADPIRSWRTTTDEFGYFAFEAMPAGSYTVIVSDQRVDIEGDRMGSVRYDSIVLAEGADVDQPIVMSAADTSVSGTIATAGGEGPIGAAITVYNEHDIPVAVTTANARGEYTVEGLTPGTYDVHVQSPGHAVTTISVTITAGEMLAGADLVAVWVGVATGFSEQAGQGMGMGLRIYWPSEISIDFTDSGVFNSSWANKVRQALANLFGEPKYEEGFLPRPPGLGDCPEALALWKEVVRWQDHANHAFENWHDRWEAAVDIIAADTGKFGISLMQLAVSMAKAATMTDGWSSSFSSVKSQLSAELKAVSDPRSIKMLTEQLARMESLNKRLLQLNALPSLIGDAIGDIGTAMHGEQASIAGVLSDLYNADSWDINGFIGAITNMTSLADEIADIAAGIEALGGVLPFKMPPGIGKVVAWMKTITDAVTGLVDLYHQFDDLANFQATFDYAIARRNMAYQRVLAAMDAFCDDDDDDDDDEPDPPPPPGPTPPCGPGSTIGIGSHDPNDKATVGVTSLGYITPDSTITYKIRFENIATATAAAQVVTVTDVLDANLDWSTFQIGTIGFNGVQLTPQQGLSQYTATASVATDPNPVSITASLDAETGTVTWVLQSIDPITQDLPADPLAGFLPPNNDEHDGEGFVTFTIQPIAGLVSGITIQNQASIVFDVNDPIETNTVINTIDAVTPVSSITTASGAQARASINLTLLGYDDPNGSGIDGYDIYVSTDGGAYEPAFTGVTDPSVTFIGEPDHVYRFYSVARDLVGHTEAPPVTPDLTMTLHPTEQIVLEGKDRKLTFVADDGTSVAVTWGKTGTATIDRWTDPATGRGDLYTISITGSDAKSKLTVKPKGGTTTVGEINVDGPLAKLTLKGVNVEQDITINGAPAKIDLGNIGDGVTITLGTGAKPVKLAVGQVTGEVHLISQAPIASIKAASWAAGSITTPWLGKVTSLGNFIADLNLSGAGVAAGAMTLAKLTAKAGTVGGTWNVTGLTGNITAGSTATTWAATFTGAVKKLAVAGNSLGSLTAASVINATIRGNLTSAIWTLTQAFNPANPKLTAIKKFTVGGKIASTTIRSNASLGKITAGAMEESTIFAGVAQALTDLPDSADDFIAEATIGSVTIKGIAGEAHAYEATNIAAAYLGKVSVRNVLTNNNGTQFGFAAKSLGRFQRLEPDGKFKWPNKDEPDAPAPDEDFVIRLI
ncbi:MAG: carboxypeptidase regulatory-like domain-containing protein [Phycisphaerales bacterium]|nr:carboxypeptidase regulatory-like domain-containing protein [Phycisphaerales bacterium]